MTELSPVHEQESPASGAAGDLEVTRPSLAEMLDAIPLNVTLWHEVKLDSEDPAWSEEAGRRVCIAARRAGGRCTVRPVHDGLLCGAHSGLLDPSEGAHARAKAIRERRVSAEERTRLARLGARGALAERAAARAADLQRVFDVLVDAAMEGDLAAAKLVGPYLNQGLGAPTERVEVAAPASAEDVASLPTSDLIALVQERRRASLHAVPEPEDGESDLEAHG